MDYPVRLLADAVAVGDSLARGTCFEGLLSSLDRVAFGVGAVARDHIDYWLGVVRRRYVSGQSVDLVGSCWLPWDLVVCMIFASVWRGCNAT